MMQAANNQQMSRRGRAGEARGACHVSTPADYAQDWPALRGRAGLYPPVLKTGRACGPGTFSFYPGHLPSLPAGGRSLSDRCAVRRQTGLGGGTNRVFTRAIDHTCHLILRAGCYTRRPRLFNVAHHTVRQDLDAAKNHVSSLSSSPVAVEANHRLKGFRVVRTAFREAGNVFRG